MERTGTRTGAVMDSIQARIASGALGPGDRLPSIRGFAAAIGVSPSTVVEAYDRLAAEGLIRSRPGSGFFVARLSAPRALAQPATDPDRAIDPFWVSRQSLDADPAMPKPGCGWLPADWMPQKALRRAMRALARADNSLLADYGETRGSLPLRRLLAGRCAQDGLDVGPQSVLLTGSGTQALDLVCRLFLRPGDRVLVDDPCYFNFRALLRAHQVEIVGVPMTAAGPDVERFGEAAEAGARLYLTNSALHNPTGATITPPLAHRLLTIAARHDIVVVEDEIFADFEPEPSPRLAVLDGLARSIRIGSFSKTLSASVRCGFVVTRADWIERLIDLQIATNFSAASPLAAEIVRAALADGFYRKHMEALRRRLSDRRRAVSLQLAALGIRPWLEPRGGFGLWCELEEGLQGAALARAALREGLVLAPGDVFSVSATASNFMRFNVAQMATPPVFEALGRAVRSARIKAG